MDNNSKQHQGRVGMYLKLHTRNRLIKFAADYRVVTGKFLSQTAAIDLLLDHYAASNPQFVERAKELA